MAPSPKPPGARVRRHTNQPQWKTLPAAPAAKPPAPPRRWDAETKKWWRMIWRSPMASMWIESDIPNLIALGDLMELPKKSAEHCAEIRQMRAHYGLTPASRKSLMWNIPAADEAEPEAAASVSNVRKLRAV